MEIALIDALIIEVQMGKRAENSFKRESFVRITAAVNLKSSRALNEVPSGKGLTIFINACQWSVVLTGRRITS